MALVLSLIELLRLKTELFKIIVESQPVAVREQLWKDFMDMTAWIRKILIDLSTFIVQHLPAEPSVKP